MNSRREGERINGETRRSAHNQKAPYLLKRSLLLLLLSIKILTKWKKLAQSIRVLASPSQFSCVLTISKVPCSRSDIKSVPGDVPNLWGDCSSLYCHSEIGYNFASLKLIFSRICIQTFSVLHKQQEFWFNLQSVLKQRTTNRRYWPHFQPFEDAPGFKWFGADLYSTPAHLDGGVH